MEQLLLKVLFDATAVPADRRGVGRYVDSIVPALAATGEVDLRLVCRSEDVEHYTGLSGRPAHDAGRLADRRPTRLVWEQTGLATLARRSDAEVLHCPHYTMPLLAGIPTVVTLHDATFFSDPEVHTAIKRRFFTAATGHALSHADGLIVPSAATRDELARLVSPRAERAQVAHLAVDTTVFHPPSPAEVAALRVLVGLPEGRGYIAFLGTIEPRKNIPALIRGFAEAFAGRADAPALVVAGGSGWDDSIDQVVAEIAPTGLQVLRPGYLPLESLRALLGGALVVAYPSLGEGFGLPVLEGMACGAPVLTTRRLALPEVGGDAVAYTEVDATSIARELAALVADPERRASLAAAGLRRAASFTWAAAASVHLETYRRASATRAGASA